jgi:hypothetical protein
MPLSLQPPAAPSRSASYCPRSTAGTATRAASAHGVSSPQEARTAGSVGACPAASKAVSAASTLASPSWVARCSSRTYSLSARPGCCATRAS